jgi:uncharacterized phage-associated protein
MTNQAQDKLADWILREVPACTHLQLQKLAFYCYGIAASRSVNCRTELGAVSFFAWKHGPVNVETYYRFRGEPAPAAVTHPQYSVEATSRLKDVVTVYGRLSPWELRNQSHLEAPWINTAQSDLIPDEVILDHFRTKFADRAVRAPEYLGGEWSLALDRVPSPSYSSFEELASRLR